MSLQLQCQYKAAIPGLTKLKPKSYILSILFIQDGFSFSIFDKELSSCVQIESWTFNQESENLPSRLANSIKSNAIKEWWEKQIFPQFKTIRVAFDSRVFTIMPKELFIPSAAKKYLSYNHTLTGNDNLFYDALPILDAVNIYAVDSGVVEMTNDLFKKSSRMHDKTLFVNAVMKDAENKTLVYCNVKQKSIDLAAVQDGKLLFVNSFPCRTKEDFAYYTILTYKQLSLNQNEIPLVLVGNILIDSGIYEIATRYIANVGFATLPPEIKLGQGFEKFQPHLGFNLFYSFLCV